MYALVLVLRFLSTHSTVQLKTANLVLWHGPPYAMHAGEALVADLGVEPNP